MISWFTAILALFVFQDIGTAQTPSPTSAAMEVVFLGSGGPRPADTDLLVFNSAVLDPPGSPAELYTRHSPPKRIGEVARASGARHLILTHIPPLIDKARAKVSASIQAADEGTVQFAEDKMRVTVQ